VFLTTLSPPVNVVLEEIEASADKTVYPKANTKRDLKKEKKLTARVKENMKKPKFTHVPSDQVQPLQQESIVQ
jgi:hypothetical protein